MMGAGIVYIAFAAAIVAAVLFSVQHFRGTGAKAGRIAYYVHAVAVMAAAGLLLYALLTHQFQFQYVYNQTDLSLSPLYRVSALWAGQEGSYLVWTLLGAGAGVVVLIRERKDLGLVMAVFALGQVFLSLFLLIDSPFKLMGYAPADGAGLNPLLLDPWMIIHPPVIFLGYALLLVPMAFSVSALVTRDYNKGLVKALPWTVMGWLFLSGGIFIGGVWAYRVLGWGGYWGWDPVENASLIPWLTGTALIHGLLVQKTQNKYVRSNHFLAIATYVLVVAAAFITRSGIMADYSVHAFATTPLTGALAAFCLCMAGLGIGLWLARFRDMKPKGGQFSLLTRPGSMALTMSTLAAAAALVLVGTLTPIFSDLMGTVATVNDSFYYLSTGPLAASILILLGLCPVLHQKPQALGAVLSELYIAVAGSCAAVAAAFFLGVRNPLDLVFLCAGVFALLSHAWQFLRVVINTGWKFSGGPLAHMGLALMLIGIFVSTNYSAAEMVQMPAGQPVEALGYSLLLQEGDGQDLDIEIDGRVVSPRIYTAGEREMREPGIFRSWWRDIYISPIAKATQYPQQHLAGAGNYFSFDEYLVMVSGFSFTQPSSANALMEINADLVVRSMGVEQKITSVLKIDGGGYEHIGANLPGSELKVFLRWVDVDEGAACFTVGYEPSPGEPLLIAEVTTKPFISVLALGTVLVLAGAAIACWRRFTTSG